VDARIVREVETRTGRVIDSQGQVGDGRSMWGNDNE
jgi:hypothetical protein